jgi:ABC-2 type transport system ATP-binding protein
MSISIKNLTKIYGEQKALDNINIEIEQGQIVGLLGPNGAGKSTMMKILTCFIPPTEGEVKVCGYDIFDNPMQVRASIGYLPEQNPLYYDMYVREFLMFIAGIHKIDKKIRKQRVEEIIELTGISKEVNKKISMLSKGYKQRVGIAQALIHDPKVLILDEPTTGLDPNQLVEIRELIKKIGQTKTVLLSTHIMQEVEAVCSRVIIINNGKLVADDETKHLASGENLEQIFRQITLGK